MANNLKEVFQAGCPDLVIDRAFVQRLHHYRQSFANRNEDHIAFFGGNLIGVHNVRFRTEDVNRWWDDILEADDLAVEEEMHKLEAIVSTRRVSANVTNMSCLYLVHAIYTSNLPEKDKYDAMIDSLMVLHYKFITSMLAHFFKFNTTEAIARATYAALSKKYGLKVHGSWGALLLSRCVDILDRKSIHYQTYTRFDDDFKIVYMVNDIQNRIKDIVKNIRDVLEIVRNDPKQIIRSTENTSVNIDGITEVKDKTRNFVTYRRYIHGVVTDRATFIREELTGVIVSAMPTMPERLFLETLSYVSLNSGPRGDKDVDVLIDETLSHAFDYLSTNRSIMQNPNDVAGLIAKMRALYMASRGSDPSLLKMRSLAEKIVQRAVKSKNASVIAAVRTGVLLYLVLRTFTMHHYSK